MEHSDPLAPRGDAAIRVVRFLITVMLLLTPVVFWRGGMVPFESCKIAVVQLTAIAVLVCTGMAACSWFNSSGSGRGGDRAKPERL